MSHISAFVKNKQTKKTRGTFHSDIIRLHAGSQEQGGVAGPVTGSDVARPTF